MPTAAKPEVTKLLDLIPSAVWAKVDMADFAAPPEIPADSSCAASAPSCGSGFAAAVSGASPPVHADTAAAASPAALAPKATAATPELVSAVALAPPAAWAKAPLAEGRSRFAVEPAVGPSPKVALLICALPGQPLPDPCAACIQLLGTPPCFPAPFFSLFLPLPPALPCHSTLTLGSSSSDSSSSSSYASSSSLSTSSLLPLPFCAPLFAAPLPLPFVRKLSTAQAAALANIFVEDS
mmetsp:Transcript_48199/g.108359  ORF Transcript_48199/g.108359 Transcript_48199/m.108359 type:complete len:238 (-) Transcript_48199:258-971(-)